MARSRGKGASGKRKVSNDVQLSRCDLSQLDESYLASLPEEQLRSLSAKLLADLKAAHERLDQNPNHSSRPPSSRAPWESEDGVDPPDNPEQPSTEAETADARQDNDAQTLSEESRAVGFQIPSARLDSLIFGRGHALLARRAQTSHAR